MFNNKDYTSYQEQIKDDKILYANLTDNELLIVYVDFLKANINEVMTALDDKNVVLRYKFMDCEG